MTTSDNKSKAYTYKRFMRDGTVEEKHAVARTKKKPKKEKTYVAIMEQARVQDK